MDPYSGFRSGAVAPNIMLMRPDNKIKSPGSIKFVARAVRNQIISQRELLPLARAIMLLYVFYSGTLERGNHPDVDFVCT